MFFLSGVFVARAFQSHKYSFQMLLSPFFGGEIARVHQD